MKRIEGFAWLTGDAHYLDYGGCWYRQVSNARFHFIALINWEDSVGEREAKEIGKKYNLALSEVDLSQLSAEQLVSAFESCCGDEPRELLQRAHACMEYGLHAPLFDGNGNNFRALFRAAAQISRGMDDPQKREERLARKVNRIGSTAAEYMRGDIQSAIDRGVAKGDRAALIIQKMHGA